jgi:hypothetical protein
VRKARRSQPFVRGRESGREQALGSVAETPRRFESVRSCGRGRVHPCCSVERGGSRASQRSTPRNGASCNRKPYFRLQLRPVKVRHHSPTPSQPSPRGVVNCRPRRRPPLDAGDRQWPQLRMACEMAIIHHNTGRGGALITGNPPSRQGPSPSPLFTPSIFTRQSIAQSTVRLIEYNDAGQQQNVTIVWAVAARLFQSRTVSVLKRTEAAVTSL